MLFKRAWILVQFKRKEEREIKYLSVSNSTSYSSSRFSYQERKETEAHVFVDASEILIRIRIIKYFQYH